MKDLTINTIFISTMAIKNSKIVMVLEYATTEANTIATRRWSRVQSIMLQMHFRDKRQSIP